MTFEGGGLVGIGGMGWDGGGGSGSGTVGIGSKGGTKRKEKKYLVD